MPSEGVQVKEDGAPGLTILIPARDEEAGISVTLEAIEKIKTRLPMPVEVLVIDDGSRDQTAVLAEESGARVERHPESGGYGRALKTGVLSARFETIAITDADGTYPIEELPAMVEKSARFDMVVGARTGPHFRRSGEPLQMAFLLMTNFVTGRWLPDPNSGFRVFHRSDVLPILDRFPNGFSFTTTLTLVLTVGGKFVDFHPVLYRQRIGRSKVRLLRDALRAGQGMLEIILVHNPLKAFLAFSLIPILAGLCSLLLPIGSSVRALIGALWFVVAVGVFALGMLAVANSGTRRRG